MHKYLLILLIFLLVPASGHAYTNDEYMQRAEKLGFFGDVSKDKPLSRAEAVVLLARTIDFNKYQQKFEFQTFNDVAEKDWYYSSLQAAVEYGIVLPQDYANNYFNSEANITNYEFINMLERVYKLHTGMDEFDFNQLAVFNQFGLENSFKHMSKRIAVISMLKLIDSIYYNARYPIDIVNPLNGTNYSSNIDIQIDSYIPKYFSKVDLYINDKCIASKNKFQDFNLDISEYAPGAYELKLKGYTYDGMVLDSLPIRVIFNSVENQEAFTSETTSDVLERTISPANYKALSNKINTKAETDKVLFVSNSPEELKNATGNVLFDSGMQKSNFRLLAYHVNNASVQSAVYIKVEMENLGIQPLNLSEHGGLSNNPYGNIAGYNSTYSYFNSYDNAAPNTYTRIRQYSVPAYSKATILTAYVDEDYIMSYMGDFDFQSNGFYRLKVYYYPSNADDILSDSDGKHIRGIFPASDYTINVDKLDTCFQLGGDKKGSSAQANITKQTFGVNERQITVNDGHFGEIYSINIFNEKMDNFLIAVEFRGTLKNYPSYFVAGDNNSMVKGYGVKSEYALYTGRQLIIDRSNQSDYNFKFTIPAGMNGPVYIYIMKD